MLQFVWHRRRLIEKWDEKKKVTSGRKQQRDAAVFQKRHAENEKCYVGNNGTLSSRGEKMPLQKQFRHLELAPPCFLECVHFLVLRCCSAILSETLQLCFTNISKTLLQLCENLPKGNSTVVFALRLLQFVHVLATAAWTKHSPP